MHQFKYKTRGESSPSGKQKVFFACHADDFDRYFPDISREILSFVNCSVWYDPDIETDFHQGELQLCMSDMQLLVIPVTERFLTEDNSARNILLPYALSNGIPVLPLMQENSLAALFNEKCGSLQYLCRNELDSSALPYSEKLEKYLSSVLLDSDLAEKIRSAFDAYIFLSYRKKDREFAKELMKLIHKNSFCRDIAIWYDEYLVPGENFTQGIEKALDECALFALAVTPSLLEKNALGEKNYVAAKEYPSALELGKKILPIELVSTDKQALLEQFRSLPDIVREDDGTLASGLSKHFSHLALTQNNDPAHMFFIGLAYLTGTDVELDRERALTLITSSAKAGLAEAMEKLSQMYKNGEGVKTDREKAIFWLEKLLETRQAEFNRMKNQESFDALARSFEQMLSSLEDFEKDDQAKAQLDAFINLCLENQPLLDVRVGLAKAYLLQGRLCRKAGRQEAIDAYGKIIKIDETVSRQTENKELMRTLARAQLEIAKAVSKNESKFFCCREALVLLEALAKDPGSERDKLGLAEGLYYMAGIQSSSKEALALYDRVIDSCEKLVKEYDGFEEKRLLAKAYMTRSELCRFEFPDKFIIEDSQRSVELYSKLYESFESSDLCVELINAYAVNFYALAESELPDGAETWLERAVCLARELVNKRNLPPHRRLLASVCRDLAEYHASTEEDEKAIDDFCESEKLLLTLIDESLHTNEDYIQLARIYINLGILHEGKGDFDRALGYYRDADGYANSLYWKIDGAGVTDIHILSQMYYGVALAKTEKARRGGCFVKDSLKLASKTALASGEYSDICRYKRCAALAARYYDRMADKYPRSKRYPKQLAKYEKLYEDIEKALEGGKTELELARIHIKEQGAAFYSRASYAGKQKAKGKKTMSSEGVFRYQELHKDEYQAMEGHLSSCRQAIDEKSYAKAYESLTNAFKVLEKLKKSEDSGYSAFANASLYNMLNELARKTKRSKDRKTYEKVLETSYATVEKGVGGLLELWNKLHTGNYGSSTFMELNQTTASLYCHCKLGVKTGKRLMKETGNGKILEKWLTRLVWIMKYLYVPLFLRKRKLKKCEALLEALKENK